MKRTQAQIKAQKKYDEKRKGCPRLSFRLSKDEYQLLEDVAKQYKLTKKEVVLKGIALLQK